MNQTDSTIGLRIMAWIGLIGMIALLVIPIGLGYAMFMKYRQTFRPIERQTVSSSTSLDSASPSDEPLGEMGSHCGGPNHLPCHPGLNCVPGSSPDELGTCLAIAADVPSSTLITEAFGLAQLGDECGGIGGILCAPGLYCPKEKTVQLVCRKINEVDIAPRILSLKIEGARPENGWYHLSSGQTANMLIQTTNVSSVRMFIKPGADVPVDIVIGAIGSVKRQPGGKFSATLQVRRRLEGTLVVVATSDFGESILPVRVASID